jgi:hypothetical protein
MNSTIPTGVASGSSQGPFWHGSTCNAYGSVATKLSKSQVHLHRIPTTVTPQPPVILEKTAVATVRETGSPGTELQHDSVIAGFPVHSSIPYRTAFLTACPYSISHPRATASRDYLPPR